MERFTKKCYTNLTGYTIDEKDEMFAKIKLGELEDIEEELGIDLITLLKVLRKGCYAVIEDEYGNLQKPQFFEKTNINQYSIGVYTYIKYLREYGYKYVLYKDYGKTWALTKEELL